MRESKVNEAVECFDGGFNCAQAVFSTYCSELGLDKTMALKIAGGLGGGFGCLQETCGAVTGAILLIGLKYGKYEKGDKLSKEKTYTLVREFVSEFKKRNGTINCRELLQADLLNDDKRVLSEKVDKICPGMVKDASEIIEEILL